MKIIAQLKNPVALLLEKGEQLSHFTPHLVTYTEALNIKALKGEFKIFAFNLKDEATEKEFQEFLKESSGDVLLASESFSSKFKIEEKTEWDEFGERVSMEKKVVPDKKSSK